MIADDGAVLAAGLPALEKTTIKVRFMPILCAVPLLYAHARQLFAQRGMQVDLRPAPGWSGIKELLTHGKIDAAHMLSPMPLACAAGIDGKPSPLRLCLIQNVNGQALMLATRHLGSENRPALRGGLTFGVPYLYSMQYYLLCHYLAEQGIDPQHEARIVEVAPPLMPLYLANGWLDGFLGPEPYPQLVARRGLGFYHLLSKQIWHGHPCCALATTEAFLHRYPRSAKAFVSSVLEAQQLLRAAGASERAEIATQLTAPQYLPTLDPSLITQALSGRFPDGRGAEIDSPAYIDFLPYPRLQYAEWIVSQMQRWGQLPLTVERQALAREVFVEDLVRELGPHYGFVATESHAGEPQMPTDPAADIRCQPFAAPRAVAAQLQSYEISPELRLRLQALLSQLAEAAGGNFDTQLEITSDDEIGWLERMLTELIRNARFTQQALAAQRSIESDALKQQAVIAAQRQLLDELSTPIIPLFSSGLLLPLIGTIDVQRAQQITEHLLAAVVRNRARLVLLDITGISTLDKVVAGHLQQVVQATSLLGARCVLIGVSPTVAASFVSLGVDFAGAVVRRDLASAIEYFFEQSGLHIVGRAGKAAR